MILNLKAIDFLNNQVYWCGTDCSIFYNHVLDFEQFAEKLILTDGR